MSVGKIAPHCWCQLGWFHNFHISHPFLGQSPSALTHFTVIGFRCLFYLCGYKCWGILLTPIRTEEVGGRSYETSSTLQNKPSWMWPTITRYVLLDIYLPVCGLHRSGHCRIARHHKSWLIQGMYINVTLRVIVILDCLCTSSLYYIFEGTVLLGRPVEQHIACIINTWGILVCSPHQQFSNLFLAKCPKDTLSFAHLG